MRNTILALLLFTLAFIPNSTSAHDWYSWRGPEQTGVSREVDLPSKLTVDAKAANSTLRWQVPYPNRSTPIVMNGRVYINNRVGERADEQERVMCLNADTGQVIWEKRFDVFHTDIVSVRLGWGNVTGDPKTGNIYWHGTQGHFVCFDKDGKILWRRSLTEEFGRITGYGGRVNSPTIDEDLVIIGMMNFSWGSHASGKNRYLAMNKHNGKVVWWWTSPQPPLGKDTYYSNPVVAVINGERVLITGGGTGYLHCMKVRTGEHVWSYPLTKGGVNPSPVVDGNYVYICHGAENAKASNIMGGVFCLDAGIVKDGQPKLVWEELGIECKYVTPLLHEGKLYVCTDIARMYCLDAKTGKKLWRRPVAYGRNAKGSPVMADGKIYVAPVNGAFAIIDPNKAGRNKVLDTLYFPPRNPAVAVETNGTPAIANGRIYIGTSEGLYCFGKKNHKGQAKPIPAGPKQPPLGEPAAVRVFPVEVAVEPGEQVTFQVQVLDKHGQVLNKQVDATWSLPVPPKPPLPPTLRNPPSPLQGTLSNKGVLTVAKNVKEQAGVVEVSTKLGKAIARVRVVPKLGDYKEDFENVPMGYAPRSWVNTQGKYFVVQLDNGGKVLRNNNKVSSPLVSRANAYIGQPTWTNLTIQADVMGTQVGSDLPDMGLIANRYRLLFWGNKQVVRLDSWDAMPRVAVPVPFNVKADVWYTMKLRVQVNGKTAEIQGKVWQRGQAEPKAWQISHKDGNPNPSGCPGLYRYGTGVLEGRPGCSVYFDNVHVSKN